MPRTTPSQPADLREPARSIAGEEDQIRQGGGPDGLDRQRRLGRLFVRERIARLVDDNAGGFFELGLWAGHKMYPDWGDVPAAGVVVGIGPIHGRDCMVIANDATVKAGAFFPQTAKKIIRAQRIAFENNLPIVYLVDSAGVFLPLQDEVFPDEDDFGRIFRNNAVLSAAGVPQYAAIMGNCVAGGAYLPVLCDKILMTEGSGLYLAGPSLVKAAIGQTIDAEDLGGAKMHGEISGTIDFREKDDDACIARLRRLIDLLPKDGRQKAEGGTQKAEGGTQKAVGGRQNETLAPGPLPLAPVFHPLPLAPSLSSLISIDGRREYDARDLLACIADADTLNEYKAEYGLSLVCCYARIGGIATGVVANQRVRTKSKKSGIQIGGVIYADAADKAARFVMDCNQTGLPIVFIQDVQGFMVGRDAEQAGIIRSGAKLVNAVSNSVVPKITLIVGGSFGAGNYALCGRAFDPRFIFAWPNARFAVMGAEQAGETLFAILSKARSRKGKSPSDDIDLEALKEKMHADYAAQTDIRYAAARGWIDAIVQPEQTRDVLIRTLSWATRPPPAGRFHTGVLQV